MHTGVAQLRNVRQDEQGRRLGEGDDTVQGGARARGQRGVVEDRRFVARGRQEEVRQVDKLRGSVHAGGGRRHQGVGRAHDPVEVSFFVRSSAYLLGGIHRHAGVVCMPSRREKRPSSARSHASLLYSIALKYYSIALEFRHAMDPSLLS